MAEYGICPDCGQVVHVLVPRGGDGSGVVFRRHKHNGKKCWNGRMICEDPFATRAAALEAKGKH